MQKVKNLVQEMQKNKEKELSQTLKELHRH
jgi:hypothetical protein